jgi:hypothetical protein
MLKADIDQMKKLSPTLAEVGKAIEGIDIHTTGDQLGDALPGANLGCLFNQAGKTTEEAFKRIAQRVEKVGTIVAQCADELKTTDEDFAKQLEAMHFRPERQH